ncbi:MAG: type II secretion system F family protein [Planctomycetota bacterium]
MAVFYYKGMNQTQKSVRGTILADSARHARDQLREKGIVVQAVQEQKQASLQFLTSLMQFSARKARYQWGLVAHELSMLLTAGIPLIEALDDLAAQHRSYMRNAILKLRDRVESGISLAAAMAEQPEVFDAASIRLVEVGENAGKLETVLAEVAEYKLQLSEFKDRVTTALMYPIFLAVFALAAMIFLMTWVMPPLLESLQETLDKLPLPTQIAKSVSDILVSYGWWILGSAVIGAIGFAAWARSESGAKILDRLLLRLPFLGPLLVKQSVARIATIVGLLTRGGVMLTTAVHLAAKSTRNSVIRQALLDAEQDMTAGGDISDSLRKSHCFPPLAVRFFAVGQESGKLDEMLQKLARDYNKQVATSAARITAFVEPVMILVLAVAVGFLLLATILPILEAGNVN